MKKLFPIYKKYPGLAYFDSAATSLKPERVIRKIEEYMRDYPANIHRGIYEISERATAEYEKSRGKIAKFIGAKSEEIVFTRGTTESINMICRGWENKFKRGEEIVLSVAEHHANLVPWQELAKRKGVRLKWLEVDSRGRIEEADLKKKISRKTRIMAVTQMSNVLGVANKIERMVKIAKKINPEILVVVDGAQSIAHRKIEVRKMGADFYAFSGHKIYGPTGIGIMWGESKRLAEMEKSVFGGGMIKEVDFEVSKYLPAPHGFEAGTPPIAEAIALGEAVDFLKEYGYPQRKIGKRIEEEMEKRKWIRRMGRGEGIYAFEVEGVHAHDVAQILAEDGVAVRAGHHCAMPLHKKLGVKASVRVSLGIYNDETDIKKLFKALDKVWQIFIGK